MKQRTPHYQSIHFVLVLLNKMQKSETFRIYNPSFPRAGWTGCNSALLQLPWGRVPLVLAPWRICSVWTGTRHTAPFASASCLGRLAVVVALCSMCIQTLPHFPGLGAWDRQEQAKDLVCLCSSSLPSATRGPGAQVSLTLDLLLPSVASNILQKPHLTAGSLIQSGPVLPGGIHMSQIDEMSLISLVPVGFGQLFGLQHFLTARPWYTGGGCVLPGWAVPQDAGDTIEGQASQWAFACLKARTVAPERCNLVKEPLLWGRRRVETPCATASLRHWGSLTKKIF